jgi:hypothetical protein
MSKGSSVIMKNSNYAINLSQFCVFAWTDNAIRDSVRLSSLGKGVGTRWRARGRWGA